MIITITCIFFIAVYILLMIAYCVGWSIARVFKPTNDVIPQTKISIIIPARNEEDNIGKCIASIIAQNYPAHLHEVIVVDDFSTDATVAVVNDYHQKNIRCIHLENEQGLITTSYKKSAITAGIKHSTGELIITTDADCTAQPNWLLEFATVYQNSNPAMIVAPVVYSNNGSFLQIFQFVDFMSMQGITVATHSLKAGNMCNGANLAFSKKIFNEVDGYSGFDHFATGDDYLLMTKIARQPNAKIELLKSTNAIITTLPQQTWTGFWQQRIRWASKSGKYDDSRLNSVLVFVYLFNLFIVVLFIAGLLDGKLLSLVGWVLLLKIVAEICFLIPVAKFFNSSKILFYFPLLQPFHILYIVVAGFLGFRGSYTWKGRKVK